MSHFVFYSAHYAICNEIASRSLKYVGRRESWMYIRKLRGFADHKILSNWCSLFELNIFSGVISVICPVFWLTSVSSRLITNVGTESRGNLSVFCKMDAGKRKWSIPKHVAKLSLNWFVPSELNRMIYCIETGAEADWGIFLEPHTVLQYVIYIYSGRWKCVY